MLCDSPRRDVRDVPVMRACAHPALDALPAGPHLRHHCIRWLAPRELLQSLLRRSAAAANSKGVRHHGGSSGCSGCSSKGQRRQQGSTFGRAGSGNARMALRSTGRWLNDSVIQQKQMQQQHRQGRKAARGASCGKLQRTGSSPGLQARHEQEGGNVAIPHRTGVGLHHKLQTDTQEAGPGVSINAPAPDDVPAPHLAAVPNVSKAGVRCPHLSILAGLRRLAIRAGLQECDDDGRRLQRDGKGQQH